MIEKATMIKQLKFYVDTYRNEEEYRKGELKFCDLFTTGVHVANVDDVFKIAKYFGINAEINDFEDRTWTKKVSVEYEGVIFFALGTEEEVSHET